MRSSLPVPARRSAAGAALVVLSFLSLFASAAHALTGRWTGDYSIPAFDNPARACAVLNGSYYVGGDFEWAAGMRARHIARWTGSEWTEVGGGLEAPIRRLEVWGSRLVAATTYPEPPHGPIVQFDGLLWRTIGPDLHGQAEALFVDGATLYAAGSFFQIGMTGGYRVMRWEGGAWQPVGGTFDNSIHALAIYKGELYAGGDFVFAEETNVSRIARWDGARWQPVDLGAGGSDGPRVAALAVYQDRLIAGGSFTSMGSVAAEAIAAWDGSAWEALPNTPTDIFVSDLQTEGDVLHVAGLFQEPARYAAGLVTFDGQNWSPPDPYPSWSMQDIAIGNGMLIAVGQHSDLNYGIPITASVPNRDVTVRDATWHALVSWKPTMRGLLGPAHTQVEALHVHEGQLYAGRYFYYAADPPAWSTSWSVARWDGDRWEPLGDGYLGGWVHSMTSWQGQLTVGSSGLYHSGVHSSVLGWNGQTWSALGGPLEGYVTSLTEWQGALVAAGAVKLPGQAEWSGVAINRGTGWEILGSRLISDLWSIEDVATFDGELYVAGSNLDVPGTAPHTLARWNGSAWVEVPDAPGGIASSLLPRADGLWVGFQHYYYSPVTPSSMWRWNQGSWTKLGDLQGAVHDLIDAGDIAFASGLVLLDGVSYAVAWWEGEQWHGIESGPDNIVLALAALGSDLYAGGAFSRTMQGQAEAIARWSFERETVAPGISRFDPPWPMPARDQVAFRFTMPREGRARILLFDLSGALVATPLDEALPAGTHQRSWSIPRGRVPAGVYFAKLELPGESRSTKLVVTR
jgi:trimeric autotransporter adhesin